jgi:POT family proton-dependent oligopeptide transporter
MVIGVIQYVMGGANLGDAGIAPAPAPTPAIAAQWKRQVQTVVGAGAALAVAAVAAIYLGLVQVSATQVSDAAGVFLLLVVAGFFGCLMLSGGWTPEEKKRLYVIAVLFFAASLFWSVFEQAGSTLNLFADRSTRNEVFGMPYPSSWFQSMNSFFIFSFAPILAWLWISLASRGKEPTSPTKFAFGLIFVGAGFLILIIPARLSEQGALVSPMWLTATYFLHTVGELCLSPVGLSAMTTLAPARIGGLMMGVWFLATSVGNFIGGRVSGFYESFALPTLFGTVAAFAIGAGFILLALVPSIRKLMPTHASAAK